MAIVKVKPTSPGRRAMVKVVNKNLHQGKPFAALLDSQSSTAGRNNNGRITTRHKGGGHKQHYRIVDFRRTKDGIPARSSVSSTTRTVARTSRWCSTQTASVATSSPRRA
jgi:large subunit ribosomal protein L2